MGLDRKKRIKSSFIKVWHPELVLEPSTKELLGQQVQPEHHVHGQWPQLLQTAIWQFYHEEKDNTRSNQQQLWLALKQRVIVIREDQRLGVWKWTRSVQLYFLHSEFQGCFAFQGFLGNQASNGKQSELNYTFRRALQVLVQDQLARTWLCMLMGKNPGGWNREC